METFSYLNNAHPAYIESLYRDFKTDPLSVDTDWKKFFEGFDFAVASYNGNGRAAESTDALVGTALDEGKLGFELKVWSAVEAYRSKAHLISKTNPLHERRDRKAGLKLNELGFTEEDLARETFVATQLGVKPNTLKALLEHLQRIYCGHIGIEYMYITNMEMREWLRQRFESTAGDIDFPVEKKKHILARLNSATVFEKFLHTKFIGQKRFSLEGGETTIPALDAAIIAAGDSGVEEIAIGMAHRGRLNVLANIIGKTYDQIFTEFEGTVPKDSTMGDGDVKYHLGYSSSVQTPAGNSVNLKLVANPSHLEAVDPVVQGFIRSKADMLYGSNYSKVLPILIHGDASVAGQGVVYEVLQMSQLKGYYTGGTIHFVINNQIGFTTDFDDARSAFYSTSVASMAQCPVLHVNGDDPEAVVYCMELAVEFRQKYNRDVFIDMVCYRRHGHNEGDDPKYTQPKMYELIGKHANPREVYIQQLIQSGDIHAELAQEMDKAFWKELQDRLDNIKQNPVPYTFQEPERMWVEMKKPTAEDFESSPVTAVERSLADRVMKGLSSYPENFDPLKKIETMLAARRKAYFDEGIFDWGIGELLAYGTLLLEGHDVRLSGQDVKRGTFSHRHAVIYDESDNKEYNRLDHLEKDQQARFRIYNSLLSEFAVLGFEYGYSTGTPTALTIWEAQFGDFANGAQTIIDQFISSGDSKWQRNSGITLLLPHGYEGQGPEHSNARPERFLQLSAEFNWSVCNITTPANFFHALRRQLKRPFRKPLVIMSPKSLLRHPKCISKVDELTQGGFKELIDDDKIKDPTKVRRVLVCSGKIYYDLVERQEKEGKYDVAIVRLEQLFPLPFAQLKAVLNKYRYAQHVWVQEEPANMGAWVYMLSCTRDIKWGMISRKASASPASGFQKVHAREQEEIITKAFE